ncbi:MAG: hypothetical protein LBU76_06345 [Azoarcus sp.]|jgi:hypothetical protein|nr:hypothetical protein [Azoarcus sp.]
MRLYDVLSKPCSADFVQVDGFINRTISTGSQQKIEIGKVGLNFYCEQCGDTRTFWSNDKIYCVGVSSRQISIDCVLQCGCGTSVAVWFLVESYADEIAGLAPEVRILKRREKMSEQVRLVKGQYAGYAELLNKAEQAYRDELGAGSIVYLRKIFEQVTAQVAQASGIACHDSKGNPRPFRHLLQDVDSQCAIIPKEYSANGYTLFGELSDVVHGDYDEQAGIQKYEALRRLVVGVLDNVVNNKEILSAIGLLGWNQDRSNENDQA